MKRVPVASTIKGIAGRNCLTGVVRPAKPARLRVPCWRHCAFVRLSGEQGAVVSEFHSCRRRNFIPRICRLLLGCRRAGVPPLDLLLHGYRNEFDHHLHGAAGDRLPCCPRFPLWGPRLALPRGVRKCRSAARLYRRMLALPLLPPPQRRLSKGVGAK